MNMRLVININYSSIIIHLSKRHSSIRNNQYYHGIYQNRMEMVIVCSLKINLTYNSWLFQLETFWEWRTEHIELITIINTPGESLPQSTIAHPRRNPSMSMNMQWKLETVEMKCCNRRTHDIFCRLHLKLKLP